MTQVCIAHKIDGALAGSYKTLLAAKVIKGTKKHLWAVLCINEDNDYGNHFLVDNNGVEETFAKLSSAIRFYEAQP